MIACRGGKHLRIPRPAKTFTSLRTVRRHIDKVGFQPPDGILIQAVDLLVRGLDISRPFQIRIEDSSRKRFFPALSRPTRHTDIPETVEREMGTHRLRRAVGNIGKLRLCIPVIPMVKIALLQDLRAFQHDLRTPCEIRLEFHKACKILSEIKYGLPGRRMDHFLHRQALLPKYRQAKTVRQMRFIQVSRLLLLLRLMQHLYRLPRILFRLPEQFVDDLSVVNTGVLYHGPLILPASVGTDDFCRTVLILDMDLSDRRHPAAVMIPFQIQSEQAHVPAPAEQHLNLVHPLLQAVQRVSHDLYTGLIIRQIRGKILFPCLTAIQIQFKHPYARTVEPGSFHRLLHDDLLLQQNVKIILRFGSDPLRLPGFRHLAGLEHRRVAHRAVAPVAGNRHPYVISRPGLQHKIQLFALPS